MERQPERDDGEYPEHDQVHAAHHTRSPAALSAWAAAGTSSIFATGTTCGRMSTATAMGATTATRPRMASRCSVVICAPNATSSAITAATSALADPAVIAGSLSVKVKLPP